MPHQFVVTVLEFFGFQTSRAHLCGHRILVRDVQSAVIADDSLGVSLLMEHMDYCYLCRSHHRVACYWCGEMIEVHERVRVHPQPDGYPSKDKNAVVFAPGEFGWPGESFIGCVKGICSEVVTRARTDIYKEGVLVPVPTPENMRLFVNTRIARSGVRLDEDPRTVHVPIRQPPRYF